MQIQIITILVICGLCAAYPQFPSDFNQGNQDFFGQNQGGFGQNQGGFGQNQGGFGQNQGGFGQNQPGFGQNQPGFGQNQGGAGQNQGGFQRPGQNQRPAQNQRPGVGQRQTTTTARPTVSTTTATPRFLQCVANCPTTSQYNPICASDNTNYHNDQKLNCANLCGARLDPNWQTITAIRSGTCTPGSRVVVTNQ